MASKFIVVSAILWLVGGLDQDRWSDEGEPFEIMFVDPNSGRVYIGATNWLYQLDHNLALEYKESLGPHPDCLSGRHCTSNPRPNHVKGLAVSDGHLVVGTSLNRGRCHLRDADDISVILSNQSAMALVANDANSSTLLLVAPGPDPEDVLYIASTHTPRGRTRSNVPAISTRSLQKGRRFKLARQESVSSATMINIEHSYLDSFKVEYKTAFSSGNFVYFAATQPVDKWNIDDRHSILIRLHHADIHYHSYTEVPLKCTHSSVSYPLLQDGYVSKVGERLAMSLNITVNDDVFFGLFATTDKTRSAVCHYGVTQIDAMFLENIQLCNRGDIEKGLEWFGGSRECTQTNFPADFDVTRGVSANFPIGGSVSIEQKPAVNLSGFYTALAVTRVNQDTVVLLGSDDGVLKMASLTNSMGSRIFKTHSLVPNGPITDLEFSRGKDKIYVLSPLAIGIYRLQDCYHYTSCHACLNARNPFCSWCPNKDRCTSDIGCRPYPWRPYEYTKCPTLTASPNNLPITKQGSIVLQTDYIEMNSHLLCIFTVGQLYFESVATPADNGSVCLSPNPHDLQSMLPSQSEWTARIALAVGTREVASTSFRYFNCSAFASCTTCTSNQFPCYWCIENHKCTHEPSSCTKQDCVAGLHAPKQTVTLQGDQWCPRIQLEEQGFIRIPSGTKKAVSVRTENLKEFQSDFMCHFKMHGEQIATRNATIRGHEVVCDSMSFNLNGYGGRNLLDLAVSWGGSNCTGHGPKYLDNTRKIMVYECTQLAENCGGCQSLEDGLGCSWCSYSRLCTLEHQCPQSNWLTRGQLCPHPQIYDFWPKSGPPEGDTLLTIVGRNLGNRVEDVEGKAKVGDRLCHVVPRLYKVGTRIGCRIDARGRGPPSTHNITIDINGGQDDFCAVSAEQFRFVNMKIRCFEPTVSGVSGGINVTFWGENLDSGSSVSVSLAGILCAVLNRTNTSLACRVGKAPEVRSGPVHLTIDRAHKTYKKEIFLYDLDAEITSVKQTKTIESGGLYCYIKGKNFELTQRVQMIILDGRRHESFGPPCTRTHPNEMLCETPPVNEMVLFAGMATDRPQPISLDLGFRIDGRAILRKEAIEVYRDPVIDDFAQKTKSYESVLTLTGQFLNLAATKYDMHVDVDGKLCQITIIHENFLTCKLSQMRPPTYSYEVLVTIGNLRFQPGCLVNTAEKGYVTIIAIIGAIVVTGTLVPLILLRIWCRWKRRQTQRSIANGAIPLQLQANDSNQCSINDQTDSLKYNHQYEIRSKQLKLKKDEKLGEGAFGSVCIGTLSMGKRREEVAVKVVLERSRNKEQLRLALMEEIKILAYLGPHVNVLRLKGAITEQYPLMLVMELCHLGSVLHFIRHRQRFITETGKVVQNKRTAFSSPYSAPSANMCMDTGQGARLTVADLISHAYQTANGMQYCAQKNVRHRDLAARNLLLNRHGIIKIADYGLARKQEIYYIRNPKMPVPWYLMSPEAIRKGKFTEKSDVWAFGLLIWELFQLAHTHFFQDPPRPFEDFSSKYELLSHLDQGKRLEKPKYMPDEIYSFVLTCWYSEANDRPTFTDCFGTIGDYFRENSTENFEHLLRLLENHENSAKAS